MSRSSTRKPALWLIWIVIVSALLGSTGCGLVLLPPGALSPTSSTTTSGTSSTGTYTPTLTGELPGSITGPGQSSTTPPTATLPAPTESASQIQALIQKYGMTSITGSGATPELLTRMDGCYAKYPAGSFRNLDIVVQPSDTGVSSEGYSGVWYPLDANGNDSQEGTVPAKARIEYIGAMTTEWTLVHEVGHHITLLIDGTFCKNLVTGLGYQLSGSSRGSDILDCNWGTWQAASVSAGSYPTGYSHSNPIEHLTEVITCYLQGGNASSEDVDQNFTGIPSNVQSVLSGKLGGGQS